MRIIILNVTPYKEKDGIVDAIDENGAISFLARSIFDPKSSFAALNNSLTIAEIELLDGKYKYPFLKAYKIIKSPLKLNKSLTYFASLLFISEISKKALQDEDKKDLFPILEDVINSLDDNDNPLAISFYYLANIYRLVGYQLETNRCVFCGSKKNIVSFSISDGGFICQNCFHEEMGTEFTKQEKMAIHEVFAANKCKMITCQLLDQAWIYLIKTFVAFLNENCGIYIKSTELFKA